MSWTAWELTHSTTWLAIIALLDIAPNVLLVPLGSVLADRYDRFRIEIIAYVVALLQALALAILAYADALTIWPLAILVTLHGAIHSFSVPAAYGLLPRFVARERLASAIAVNSAYTQAAILVGPALAGWVILHFGSGVAFAINAAGYVVFLVSAAFLRTPADYKQPPRSDRSVMGDFIDGARYIFGHHGITTLLVLMLLGDVLAVSLFHMLPAFSTGTLGLGIEGMTTILAVYGAGATLAALWLAHGGSTRISSTPRAAGVRDLCLRHRRAGADGQPVARRPARRCCGASRGRSAAPAPSRCCRPRSPTRSAAASWAPSSCLSRIAGGIGTYLVGAAAEQHGLQVPMLIAVGVCLLAWGYAYTRRRAIQSSFVDRPPIMMKNESAP